jgi:3-hydroxybutyryl-CoA dehydrogenase
VNVSIQGESKIRFPLEVRIEQAGHQASPPESAQVLLDCRVTPGPRFETNAHVLALCYASSATQYASRAPDPSRVIGFSCIPSKDGLSLIELAQPLQGKTSNLEYTEVFFGSLGLETVRVPDSSGLIAARTVACLANEAFSALASGIADAHTIDTAMRLGTNYPLGPLEWAERIGLEAIAAILDGLHSEFGEAYRVHPLLRRLVEAGCNLASLEQHLKEQVNA